MRFQQTIRKKRSVFGMSFQAERQQCDQFVCKLDKSLLYLVSALEAAYSSLNRERIFRPALAGLPKTSN